MESDKARTAGGAYADAANEKPKRVLFLCSGNYYRSRFAEILFNWEAERRGLPWRAESRGLALDSRNPGPVSQHTAARLRRRGIDSECCQRLPQAATPADFASADLVVAVKRAEHHALIEASFRQWLPAVEFWHVHDLDCAGPDETLLDLEQRVADLIDRLARAAR